MDRLSPQNTSMAHGRTVSSAAITLWCIVACLCVSAGAASAAATTRTVCDRGVRTLAQSRIVRVQPSGSLAGAVETAPDGTTFCLQPGVYRLAQPIVPKTGDSFVGSTGSVISGALVL